MVGTWPIRCVSMFCDRKTNVCIMLPFMSCLHLDSRVPFNVITRPELLHKAVHRLGESVNRLVFTDWESVVLGLSSPSTDLDCRDPLSRSKKSKRRRRAEPLKRAPVRCQEKPGSPDTRLRLKERWSEMIGNGGFRGEPAQ